MLPITEPYPWQQNQWAELNRLISQEKLPHALVLCGPRYLGKEQFGYALAQRLLCDNQQGQVACGVCKQCSLFTSQNHPDVLRVLPEEEGKAIRVDRIRQLSEFTEKTAQQNGWKIVIISPADAMNMNAANALLKTLEEPARKTLLILVCHQLSRLSATVRSRCQKIVFPVPAPAEVHAWLSSKIADCDSNEAELLQYAEGRPLLALELLQTDLLEVRRSFDKMLDELASGQLSAIVAAQKFQSLDTLMAIDWLYSRLALELKTKKMHPGTYRYLDRLIQIKRRLQAGGNPNKALLWEELMLDWQLLLSLAPSRRAG
ncbi:MAG: DNA polymerase III subunit delta' [Porticoccus sp.]|jgi:DNA polymerase-3 subunit delta'|uniref:DNA polymerase III subunit delta' n=1 Tax=Porticoccus sp. TaxID=2024853 RepID=UPI00329854BD